MTAHQGWKCWDRAKAKAAQTLILQCRPGRSLWMKISAGGTRRWGVKKTEFWSGDSASLYTRENCKKHFWSASDCQNILKFRSKNSMPELYMRPLHLTFSKESTRAASLYHKEILLVCLVTKYSYVHAAYNILIVYHIRSQQQKHSQSLYDYVWANLYVHWGNEWLLFLDLSKTWSDLNQRDSAT